VKTGSHVEKQPQDPDWWYTRCASVLRKVYVHGPIGAEELRADYGGRSGSVVRREHAVKAGGSIVRKALQQLEAAGLVESAKPQGRRVTREGRKLLQELAEEISKDLMKELPELEKYQKGE
jgi:small subunit ribosomal protein S19e